VFTEGDGEGGASGEEETVAMAVLDIHRCCVVSSLMRIEPVFFAFLIPHALTHTTSPLLFSSNNFSYILFDQNPMTHFVKYATSDGLAKHLIQLVSLISQQFIEENGVFNIGVSGGSIPVLMKGFFPLSHS
jgi:hypothetical protein